MIFYNVNFRNWAGICTTGDEDGYDLLPSLTSHVAGGHSATTIDKDGIRSAEVPIRHAARDISGDDARRTSASLPSHHGKGGSGVVLVGFHPTSLYITR